MRRERKAPDDDTTTYLLRNVPGELWRAARVRAVMERRDMRDVLLSLIREYGEGKPTIGPKGKRRK
jgi:hypothetical protein